MLLDGFYALHYVLVRSHLVRKSSLSKEGPLQVILDQSLSISGQN